MQTFLRRTRKRGNKSDGSEERALLQDHDAATYDNAVARALLLVNATSVLYGALWTGCRRLCGPKTIHDRKKTFL
jgi:hypothetical protein